MNATKIFNAQGQLCYHCGCALHGECWIVTLPAGEGSTVCDDCHDVFYTKLSDERTQADITRGLLQVQAKSLEHISAELYIFFTNHLYLPKVITDQARGLYYDLNQELDDLYRKLSELNKENS